MPPRALPPDLASVARELQRLPDVGPATAEDLVRLGVRNAEDLARRDAREMYDTLCALDGARHDPRVRDVFSTLVERARTGTARSRDEQARYRKAREADLPSRVRARLARDTPRTAPATEPAPEPRPKAPRPAAAPRRAPEPLGDRPAASRWREARDARRG